MMKVGIITFHWAANYGAVLQAYALQKALEKNGIEVEIINYIPQGYITDFFGCFKSRNIRSIKIKLDSYKKKKSIDKYVTPLLHLSRIYKEERDLIDNPPEYDLYITGSDQVWNEEFTLQGEKKETFTYFLSFVSGNKRKISYATSIGKKELVDRYWKCVIPFLKDYDSISVREESACKLLQERGIKSIIMPDPTLLIKREYYDSIFSEEEENVVFYRLHEGQTMFDRVMNQVTEYFEEYHVVDAGRESIHRWGGLIKNARLVVTNSYHGVIFSILYHRPFISIPVEGENVGMNDRIDTLLGKLGIKNRIINSDIYVKNNIIDKINWDKIEKKITDLRVVGTTYLLKNIDILRRR